MNVFASLPYFTGEYLMILHFRYKCIVFFGGFFCKKKDNDRPFAQIHEFRNINDSTLKGHN